MAKSYIICIFTNVIAKDILKPHISSCMWEKEKWEWVGTTDGTWVNRQKWENLQGKEKLASTRSNQNREGYHFQIPHLYPRNYKLNPIINYGETFLMITYSKSLSPCKQAILISDIKAHHEAN